MCTIAMKIPDEVLFDIKMTEARVNDFAKRYMTMMLYTQKHISIGYSAQIAGMTEEEFIKFLSSNGVSIFSFDDENGLYISEQVVDMVLKQAGESCVVDKQRCMNEK